MRTSSYRLQEKSSRCCYERPLTLHIGQYGDVLRMLHWEVLRTSSFSFLRTSVGNISWHYIENHLGTSSGRPRDVILSSVLVSTEKITRSVLPWLLYHDRKKKGVSTQMKKVIYSLSLSTQCYAYCLKLVCGDWVRNSTVLSKLLETSHEII